MKANKIESEENESIIKSFKNLYAFFIEHQHTSKDFLDCIQNWSYQLILQHDENLFPEKNNEINFYIPENKMEALEQVYDVVYMIYLDQKVEDVELEITTLFAKALGFPDYVVEDILNAIITTPHDGIKRILLRKELKKILQGEKN